MSKFIVETFYTCTFKITHKLDELNEKKLSELENRNDGQVKIIDVKLNNRKTRKIGADNKIVRIVIPDIGLLDDPTTPAIYAATAENKKARIKTMIVITKLNSIALNILK